VQPPRGEHTTESPILRKRSSGAQREGEQQLDRFKRNEGALLYKVATIEDENHLGGLRSCERRALARIFGRSHLPRSRERGVEVATRGQQIEGVGGDLGVAHQPLNRGLQQIEGTLAEGNPIALGGSGEIVSVNRICGIGDGPVQG